jgi:VWFA-related protein
VRTQSALLGPSIAFGGVASRCAVFLLAMLGIAHAGQAQRPAFGARTDLVVIDLQATDARGEVVADLRREDFRIFDNGQPREIAAFTGIRPESQPDATSATSRGERETSATPRIGARTYLLVLDDLHIRAEHSSQARLVARAFLNEALAPGDRVRCFFTSGRASNLREQPTGDRQEVERAIELLAGRKIASVGLSRALRGGDEAGLRLAQARTSLEALARIAQLASESTDSRRTLVLVSEGIDVWSSAPDVGAELRRMATTAADALNGANVTLYALDPRGAGQRADEAIELGSGTRLGVADLQAELRFSQESLQVLADQTGGVAFVNTSDFQRAARLIEREAGACYLLGFVPAEPTAGQAVHVLDVRVARPGVTLRARRTYRTPTRRAAPPAAERATTSSQPPAAGRVDTPAPSPVLPLPAPPQPTTGEPPAPSAPTLDAAVTRASRYVVDYGERLALAIGVERYAQWVLNGDASTAEGVTGQHAWSRNTVSEFALVRVKNDWLGLRDVFEVDGKKVGDRKDRLLQLFSTSADTAVEQGRRVADESARYNAGALQRNFNVPTTALFFLHPANSRRFTFTRQGTERIEGVDTWQLRYQESSRPTIIRTSAGKDMPVSGTVWVDPLDGRVLRTHMQITSEAKLAASEPRVGKGGTREWSDRRVETSAAITVTYRTDEKLALLVPGEMRETYQGVSVNPSTGQDRVTKITCVATYSDWKRFETSGRMVEPKR